LAKAAHSNELSSAFEKHAGETQGHVDRLEQVFNMIGKSPRGKTCPAILGLIEEGQEIMQDFKDTDALDAGLLAGAQAVEHYEISRYGTLVAWAKQMGLSDAARLLEETLAEEKTTDESLTAIAETAVNYQAAAE
jgi:ferritin-like metal-binding protein YciE